MADGRTEAMLRRSAGPGSQSVAGNDPNLTVELLLATLANQRRANQTLYRLVRSLIGVKVRTVRSSAFPRARRRRHLIRSPSSPVPEVPVLGTSPEESPMGPGASASDAPSSSAPSLQIRCFGRFEVYRDGQLIQQWRRTKAKTLLKYLVIRRQPSSRDALIDLLWPEADPQQAINGLRVTVHALRQTLGQYSGGPHPCDYVISEGGNYLLNPDARIWVDADDFARHFETACLLERQRQTSEAIRHYEQAEALYRDDFLLEDLYEEWTIVRREELKDQYLMLLTKLADQCLVVGDSAGCIARCYKILQKDACREDTYQRLMQCYARLGQRSQALRCYDLCARTLKQELEVSPSEQTRRLYEQIAAGIVV